MTKALTEVAALVHRQTGIWMPPSRTAALQAALRRVTPELGAAGFLRSASDPAAGPALLDRLIEEVTVQETSFVRDRGQLDPIPWRSLGRGPDGSIRVWSAGCATGEEAYTLALLASESFAPANAPVNVLGTDVSGAALDAARAGHYRERSVRGLEAALRHRYLERQPDGGYLVAEPLRALVRFRRHNLVRDPLPPPGEPHFDLIVCRNVLIYFDAPTAARVSSLLERSLAPGGMLVLGAADIVARTAALGIATGAAAGSHRAGGARRAESPASGKKRPPGTHQAGRARGAGAPRSRGESSKGAQRAGRAPVALVPGSREQRLATAHAAASAGDSAAALAQIRSLLAENQLDADAQFLHGLVILEAGDPAGAATALRRALYVDPSFALAAFTLGRAQDALGDAPAARRAYAQALRSLDPQDRRHEPLLQQINMADIAAACRARLAERR